MSDSSKSDARSRFSVGTAGDWVVEREFPPAIVDESDSGNPVSTLLTDKQFRLGSREIYSRSVELLNTSEGVQQLSQLDLAFDPKLESLRVHRITILRDGTLHERLDEEKFQLVQREQSLERQIYDGRLSALLLIEDVRPGDILDISYTLLQDHDAHADHFYTLSPMQWPIPIGSSHVSLIAPEGTSLQWKVQADPGNKVCPPEITENGSETLYHWHRENIEALSEIPFAPVWHPVIPILQITDYENWEQVGRWVVDLWNVQLVHPDLQELIPTFQADSENPAEHARRAVDFVQQDIRYLGLEDGIGGMRPSAPAEVLRRRFGDCKDKSLLLSTLLRMMKIPAAPVLVSVRLGKGVDDHLPMPNAFDHVIVRVQLDGENLWIDATDAHQRGPLAKRWPASFGRGLQINSKAPSLVTIPDSVPDGSLLRVREDYLLGAGERPAKLRIETFAKGLEATRIRALYRSVGLKKFSSIYEEGFQQFHPKAKREGELTLDDDEQLNTVAIVENFVIPEFNQLAPDQSFRYASFGPNPLRGRIIPLPDDLDGQTPWPLEFPCVVRNRIRVTVPWTTRVEAERTTVENDQLRFEYRSRQMDEKTVEILFGYDSKLDHVPPESFGRYRTDFSRLADSSNYIISLDGSEQQSWEKPDHQQAQRPTGSRRRSSHSSRRPATNIGMIAGLAGLVLIVILRVISAVFPSSDPGPAYQSQYPEDDDTPVRIIGTEDPDEMARKLIEDLRLTTGSNEGDHSFKVDPTVNPRTESLDFNSSPESPPRSNSPRLDSDSKFRFDP